MIVLLDTTALMADLTLGGTAWQVIAQAAPAWGVEIFVPKVVLIEAIGGHRRLVDEAIDDLDRWSKKYTRRLQLDDPRERIRVALAAAHTGYEQHVVQTLNELGAVVLEPPDIPHHVLVERAVRRQRPCDDRGDGYRDTLNWLTVLSVAAEHPDDDLVWISDNTKDFGAGASSLDLHPDLQLELETVGAAGRVRWMRSLSDVVLDLAASHSTTTGGGLEAVRQELEAQSLAEYVQETICPTLIGKKLSPRRCGLPLLTVSATILDLGEVHSLKAEVRGTLDGGLAMAELAFEAQTTIEAVLPSDTGESDAAIRQLTKALRYTGPITRGSLWATGQRGN